MTMDYLFSEHITRSAGNIRLPGAIRGHYLFFKFQTYGHTPGTFYGESGVWPYLPKKVVTVSNAQLNWITARKWLALSEPHQRLGPMPDCDDQFLMP